MKFDDPAPQLKKSTPLAKFEFNLFKILIQLEQTFGIENNQILLNLQISGGKDSMCLLNAFSTVLSSHVCKLKNKYILVAQHFNHKQRAQESDEDAFFVVQECLKKGIPVYLNSLSSNDIHNNYQEHFRNWRKKEAHKFSGRLVQEFNCTKYFIVTAHHARDHVETVLLHLLRGSGVEGLKGISLFDEEKIYFRPFCSVPYEKITNYAEQMSISFREDSSNLGDKYKRNYIRKHILPHLEHLQQDYENSFVKLSQHIQSTPQTLPSYGQALSSRGLTAGAMMISQTTSHSDLFYYFKSKCNMQNISENCIKNVLHEAKLLLQKKGDKLIQEIPLKFGESASLVKNGEFIEVRMNQK